MANSVFVRVVLDTNVLISAVLKPDGLEAAVVNAAIAGDLEAWITAEILAEYEEVFERSKFASVRDASRNVLDALRRAFRQTAAISAVTVALDADDNRFIECAAAAKADFLVTGNLRHYPADYGVTRIVNARQLLALTQLPREVVKHP